MNLKIKKIKARQILDSNGNSTVEAALETDFGTFEASVPPGISTGKYEAAALEAEEAIENIEKIIGPALVKKAFSDQEEIDQALIRLDATKNKSRLGANAILAVSIAACRAASSGQKIPLWKWISKISKEKPYLSQPSVLMFEGGLHAVGGPDIQEFMLAGSFSESKRIYKALGKYKLKTGMEGGFVMPAKSAKEVLDLVMKAAGRKRIKIILDIAASHLRELKIPEYYLELAKEYPILGVEDPYSQDDLANWQKLNLKLKTENLKLLIIGDDLTVTNPGRIKEARKKNACNAVIIKPNQIGTVSEAMEAAKLAKSYGWKIIVSHRSGETADSFIADFAVGIGADYIKSGAPFPKERMAKYNRLAEIETEINKK